MPRHTLTPSALGLVVRATRKAAGLRQDELAGAAGVGLRFVVELERGKPTAQIGNRCGKRASTWMGWIERYSGDQGGWNSKPRRSGL